MNNRILSLVLICLIFCACQPSKTSESAATTETQKPTLVGTWTNTSLTVTIKEGDVVDSVLSVPDGQWEQVMQFQPIVTTYANDGTFGSTYLSLAGDTIGLEAGTWEMKGDSMFLNSAGYHFRYKVEFDGNKVHFVSQLDWDEDGKQDDLYDGWQKRMEED